MKEVFEINPFIVNNPIEVVALPKKVAINNSDDLASPIDKLLDSHYLHDAQDKTNVYRWGKRAMYEIIFGRLTDKSRSLFLYIMYSINKNEDFINLSAKKVGLDIGMSKRTLVDALKELKSNQVITMKSRSVYWVNPNYIFNGNRIEYYRNISNSNVLVKSIIRK